MSKIDELIARLGQVSTQVKAEVMPIAFDKKDEILAQVRSQLERGEDGKGNPLRPTYEEDIRVAGAAYNGENGWFKDRAGMEAYIRWKKKAFDASVPANGSPNLYINGQFYESLDYVMDGDDAMRIVSDTSISKDGEKILTKWGRESFEPNAEWLKEQMSPGKPESLLEKIIGKVRNLLGLCKR